MGQFVTTETRVLSIYMDEEHKIGKEIHEEIHQCLWIGNKKTENKDFSFTIQKIVEIALRAISPFINDPNTAIHCLRIIGLLLRDLADIDNGYVVMRDENENGFLIFEAYNFEILLYDAYQQIIFYSKYDASVTIAVLKSLRLIKVKASSDNSQVIDNYAKNLFDKLLNNGYDPLEYVKIYKEYNALIELKKTEDI